MKKINFLFTLFLSVALSAQTISGKVVSKEDQKPIPFAKIGILNDNFGVQADEQGNFEMNLDQVPKDKDLMVIVGGFEKFEVNISKFLQGGSHNISLHPKETKIQEVAIKAANYKEKNLGVNTKTKSVMVTPNMEKGEDVIKETAVEFSSNKRLKIMKINMNFARFESTTPINIRYTIYDEKDGKPNNLIVEKDLIAVIQPSDIVDQTYTIDVSKEGIWMEGKFFVGIQFIGQSNGKVALSGALMRKGFYRSFYGNWEKLAFAAPAINIDVKVKK